MADEERKAVKARVRVEGARLSFAQNLWRPATFRPQSGAEEDDRKVAPKYKSNFLIPKTGGLKAFYPFRQLTGDAMKALKVAKIDAIEHRLGDITKATALERKIRLTSMRFEMAISKRGTAMRASGISAPATPKRQECSAGINGYSLRRTVLFTRGATSMQS